jgi:hypothetical protein
MFRQTTLGITLSFLIAVDAGMAALAVARYPAFFEQHSALVYVLELAGILLLYAVVTALLLGVRDRVWNRILTNASAFGVITGALEIVNIGLENSGVAAAHMPAFPIGFMVIVFSLWSIAGVRTVRSGNSTLAGVTTAVLSAGICMLLAVACGFLVELLVAPPDPAVVSTWAEYRRSGWTDPRAFGLANTIDSGFTHLVIAPIVAVVFGGIGSVLARFVKPTTGYDQSGFQP